MTNSVDPDQTAPSGAVWSGSALFAYAILSAILVYRILGHLPYSMEAGWYCISEEYTQDMILVKKKKNNEK